DLFFSREPINDPRLGDMVLKNTEEAQVLIAGYPDDEAITNNMGRIGAKEGPDRIRHFLYRMTPPLLSEQLMKFSDVGNLETTESLEQRHQVVESRAYEALCKEQRWVGLGGGHDYGFPDGAALIKYARQ